MHPKVQRSKRRVHGAEFKAKVLAQCHEPQASVAAVALANGLNANMVRRWLAGRGLKRMGLTLDGTQPNGATPVTRPPALPRPVCTSAPGLQFVPVGVAEPSHGNTVMTGVVSGAAPADATHIEVELHRGSASLAVKWPLSQAQGCTAWLRELHSALLK
jgi:transposase